MAKKPDKKIKAAFKEVYKKEPKVVAKTRKKKGKKAAQKQKVAIALSKARAKGANIPNAPSRKDVINRIGERAQNA